MSHTQAIHHAGAPVMHEHADYWISEHRIPNSPVSASIVIPVNVAAPSLARALESALAQTLREIEVIVVVDDSADDAWPTVAAWLARDARVRAIRNKQNSGKSTALNRGIFHARGRWVAGLNADDWYGRDRIAALTAVAEGCRADLVADNQFLCDSAGAVVASAWPAGTECWDLTFDEFLNGADPHDAFHLGMLKPLVSMSFVQRTGLAYERMARNSRDFLYMLQFYLLGGAAVVVDAPHYYGPETPTLPPSRPGTARADPQIVRDMTQVYLASSSRASPAQRARLAARNRQLQTLEHFARARDFFRQRRWAAALGETLRRPGLLACGLRRLVAPRLPAPPAPAAARVARRGRARRRRLPLPPPEMSLGNQGP